MTSPDKDLQDSSWLAGAGTLLSLIACYGTLALVALLAAMGVTLSLNVHVWAAVIVAFALLALLGVTLGYRRHRKANPVRLAVVGTAMVTWAMYGGQAIRTLLGVPPTVVEIAGFAALIAAAYWDWRLQR